METRLNHRMALVWLILAWSWHASLLPMEGYSLEERWFRDSPEPSPTPWFWSCIVWRHLQDDPCPVDVENTHHVLDGVGECSRMRLSRLYLCLISFLRQWILATLDPTPWCGHWCCSGDVARSCCGCLSSDDRGRIRPHPAERRWHCGRRAPETPFRSWKKAPKRRLPGGSCWSWWADWSRECSAPGWESRWSACWIGLMKNRGGFQRDVVLGRLWHGDLPHDHHPDAGFDGTTRSDCQSRKPKRATEKIKLD